MIGLLLDFSKIPVPNSFPRIRLMKIESFYRSRVSLENGRKIHLSALAKDEKRGQKKKKTRHCSLQRGFSDKKFSVLTTFIGENSYNILIKHLDLH